tara:strand:- start:123 stop:746 length:624 start_codon:yes stop_codon:yes gene_type:complete
MHKLNILISGPPNFVSTFEELKPYFKFNLSSNQNGMPESLDKFDILICCDESMKIKNIEDILRSFKSVKILASKKIENNLDIFDHVLTLPTSVREMNNIIESSVAKKKFSENSSIRIKTYFLDKNEKKLFKEKNFLILTEKEIQLIELLSSKEKPFSKKEILSLVWDYSSDADTHTVETHIYRLRKKINEKFLDEKFILNNEKGYFL